MSVCTLDIFSDGALPLIHIYQPTYTQPLFCHTSEDNVMMMMMTMMMIPLVHIYQPTHNHFSARMMIMFMISGQV